MAESGQSSKDVDTDTDVATVKNKRKLLRCKITRTINRIKESISKGEQNVKRFKKELEQLRRDYDVTCDLHGQLYDLVEETDHAAMDKWEGDLTNAVFSIEEEVEAYLPTLVSNGVQSLFSTDHAPSAEHETGHGTINQQESPEQQPPVNLQPPVVVNPITSAVQPVSRSFDAWIDDLVEFQETVLPQAMAGDVTIADALFKLEASKDIPSIKLLQFDGSALSYPDFIDRFKIHIHDKTHLKDDMRMIQLKMHVTGEAERAISGLGSKGLMYATALKSLKEQFGQPSMIARAVINKLTKGERIQKNNRQALREFSLDTINCLATIKQINYYADVNANDNLRKIVMRLPDHLIHKWKTVAADVREKGQVPTLQHISDFVRKRVKAEFDPDFGDVERDTRSHKTDFVRERRGIHATQRHLSRKKCYVCEGEHGVSDCPTLADSTVNERFEAIKNARLCFSCLNKGHMTRDCRSRKRCEKNGCNRFHHPLLHTDPPTASGVASVLDRNSIMPVVRVRFRAANGRVREGNALIDSGAGTTVIRRDFAKALGLQGKRERIDLAVVGGERVEQPESRRVSFWISALDRSEEFKIEAHEIEKTILSVPALNRQWLNSFSHLRDVNFPHKAGPVDLILGVQYSHLHAEDETRQGQPFEPVGKKTKLGWFAIGSDDLKRTATICSISFVQPLNLEKFYELETLGIQAPDCSCPKPAMSRDDKKAMELMEASCEHQGTRYTIGLPWKKDKRLLPNNYALAERRLLSQEKSLLKNKTKAKMYEDALMDYEKNGWARPLSKQELETGTEPVEEDPERKKTKIISAVNLKTPVFDPQAYSSWTRLTRITAYTLRFLNNMKASREDPTQCQSGPLQPDEITSAERYWILEAQRDLVDWQKKHQDLTPFVENGIVRVGGRLQRSQLTYDQIHPILLPAEHHISKLILEDVHQKLSHAGCERTLSESRRQYWIVRGRNLAKYIARNCTVCRKLRQPPHTTLMADLPPERIKPFSPPFTVTGVDLFGPFNLKIGRNKSTKAWGALFTCATVRAIHLEIVESPSSEAFLQALRRFASHHGWPTTVISDNGKNFVGAEKELRKLLVEGRKQIEDFAVLHKIRWIFTTPLSPHQGGIYESLIKQTKRALRVAVGTQALSWNEMATVFAEAKSLVNSRPLGYASNDPNDPQPLTPNHFILGRASSLVPQGPFEESRNPRRRFQFVQSLAQHFWRRFVREYLPTLMRRTKWQSTGRQMSVGDIVLLVDYNAPRGKWDLARVQQVFPGSDGVIRNVQVKTKNGQYKRSIQKCCIIHEAN